MDEPINEPPQTTPAAKPRRGFASMDPNKLRAVSSKGGSAPHTVARGFAIMDEEARREASLKGVAARRGRTS